MKWKWILNFLVWLQSRKENIISWSIWLDGGQGLEKRKENRVFVSDHGFDQTMNYAYTGRTGGRQTSIQFTNRILFFISSSYPKIFPHTTLPKGRSATIRPLESTAGCMLIILSRNPSPVSMAPIPTTQCHRREPSIRQMTVFSSRRPSFQRVIYPWLCPLAITQQSQIWSDWPNKHYSKRPWRCQPR